MQTIQHVQPGWAVYGSDGSKIGDIAEVDRDYLTMSKGLILPKTYHVPLDAITHVNADEGSVVLDCSKDDFEAQGWDQEPVGRDGTYTESARTEDDGPSHDMGTDAPDTRV